MIITPFVPTLVEETTSVGIESENEAPGEDQKEFATTASIADKASFIKQSVVTMIYIMNALEQEAEMHEKMKNLAEERLSKIQSLEAQLADEKTTSNQLQQSLNKANEELQKLIKEKELSDRNCSEAFKKIEELKILHNKSQEKIVALEEEKSQLTSIMVGRIWRNITCQSC